ncbi:redoxin family protein [Candidatus Woesearchaeota archaeon]|jgi:thiol-disulfide isomerase/thioredoxin|nr:redoxin family protein [Candidatus Woesearchaeota archaeon]MBT4110222.1 redoxin family protein [Candidatus Woesearchaeota archaeon]MBT4336254.1 redoxin family protein [Candidatus Woesearchaeota archaeon]MBT4468767.1 redoxin family protein [Candidatus Woesearchaeota archaeon]MBT6744914.1 redoxin family protein [Candidatus Woesearchaeota archaeon]
MLKKIFLLITVIIIGLILIGCSETEVDGEIEDIADSETIESEMFEEEMEEIAVEKQKQLEKELENVDACDDWKCEDLVDVLTGETFQIKDFEGKPVLVESFAVWCPTCLKQQLKMKELLESDGDNIVHISFDTDPNEEPSLVKEHAEKNGLNWRFTVSPKEVTKKLIEEFGIGVVNAPSAPVILVCEDQTTRLLEKGVKSAEELKEEISGGC